MNDEIPRPMVQEPGTGEAPPLAEPPLPEVSASSHRSALLIVFLVVFIDLLGFGIVLPLLPLYADEILEPLFPGQARMQGMYLGLLMASFSAMQFFFAPMWGRLSDRIGRRPILLLGLFGSVVFYTLFGIASDLALGGAKLLALGLVLLFVARLGAGVAGATISTAQAVIADLTTPEKRARGMALIGAAFGIGFTFGPLLGFASLFVPVEGAPGYMAAFLSLIAFTLGFLVLPETLRTGSSAHLRRRLVDWGGLRRVLRTPSVGILVITFFLVTLAFGGLESTLALVNKLLLTGEEVVKVSLTREAWRTTERSNFLVFAYVGLILMLTQGFFYRRLVQRVGEVRFLKAGIVLMGLGLAGAVAVLLARYDVISRPALLGVALGIMTVAVIGFALVTPSVQSLISRRSDPAKQGEVLGVNQSGAAMARILGPLVGLPLFKLTPSHAWPFALGTILLACTFLLSLRIRQE